MDFNTLEQTARRIAQDCERDIDPESLQTHAARIISNTDGTPRDPRDIAALTAVVLDYLGLTMRRRFTRALACLAMGA